MLYPIICLGDRNTHAGFFVQGTDKICINGKPVVLVTHVATCPIHKIAWVMPHGTRYTYMGLEVCTEAHMLTCGCRPIASQNFVLVGDDSSYSAPTIITSPPKATASPITGDANAGILKRYANAGTLGAAFPEHLTAADEKGLGSKVRGLYGGNDTIQNQADIEAYNNMPSITGTTHGKIFDASEAAVSILGIAEAGITLSKIGAAAKSKILTRENLGNWYKEQGEYFKDPKNLESHLEGTDFSKTVKLTTLPESTELIQYVRADGKPGMYFARPGTAMESLGIQEPPPRIIQKFIVRKPIAVIESTSATLAKELAPGVGGTGGGQQLIFPKGWEKSVDLFFGE